MISFNYRYLKLTVLITLSKSVEWKWSAANTTAITATPTLYGVKGEKRNGRTTLRIITMTTGDAVMNGT